MYYKIIYVYFLIRKLFKRYNRVVFFLLLDQFPFCVYFILIHFFRSNFIFSIPNFFKTFVFAILCSVLYFLDNKKIHLIWIVISFIRKILNYLFADFLNFYCFSYLQCILYKSRKMNEMMNK